jgi:RimJ/RimL family protein N-acetyltransferase
LDGRVDPEQARFERVELSDGRVRLRSPSASDLDDLVAACRDTEAVRWTSVPQPYGPAEAEAFLRIVEEGWTSGRTAIFFISTAEHGDRYCGAIDLRLDGEGGGEVGFVVAPWARSRGVCTAALRLVCRWGFDSLGLGRIEWLAHVGNEPSRRVAEKAGFRYEGVQRAKCLQRGVRHDAWVAGLLPGELR